MMNTITNMTNEEKADYEAVLHIKSDVFKKKYPKATKCLALILRKMQRTIGEDATIYSLIALITENRQNKNK